MTLHRRVTAWLLIVVAAALGVAGLGSQLLVRAATLDEARRDVANEARQVAAATEDLRRPATFAVLRQTLRLKGAAVVRFTPAGVPLTALPAGVHRADLRPASLAAGSTVSGIRGTLVYAAAPVPVSNTRSITAVVFTRELNGLSRGARFFALSALGTLVLAAIVGSRLGRRIARPIELAEDTTRRMADGDLSARIELPAGADAEVTSLAASIGSLASSLERSRATERDFLLSVSHDLRTPLTAIRGYGEALSDGAITDNARAGAVITSEARRLERLVGDLLDLARLGAGTFSFDTTEVRLDDVVAGIADALQPAAAAAGVELVAPAPVAVTVAGDPDRLAQVVANLVENALSFAAARVTVELIEADGVTGGFRISDDGPGIPSDEQSAVFARHYRSAAARGRRLGTGLGLAIVAELVAAMRGTITVNSPTGDALVGTEIVVRLPAANADES
ncbi:MAG: two-component system, OmpR family, sensor kinase [Actinomycetota bacterium]